MNDELRKYLFFESDRIAVYKGIRIEFCQDGCHQVEEICRHLVPCCDLTYKQYVENGEFNFNLFIDACEKRVRYLIREGHKNESDLITEGA